MSDQPTTTEPTVDDVTAELRAARAAVETALADVADWAEKRELADAELAAAAERKDAAYAQLRRAKSAWAKLADVVSREVQP